ncbi:hypothetical protein EGW08_016985, partial [Elysia chlorotica]
DLAYLSLKSESRICLAVTIVGIINKHKCDKKSNDVNQKQQLKRAGCRLRSCRKQLKNIMSDPGKHPLAWSVGAVGTAVVSFAIYTGWFWTLFWTIAHIVLAALGFYYAVQWNLVCGKRYKPQLNPKLKSSVNIVIQKIIEFEAACVEPPKKVVISRSLDNALQEVIDLGCRHFILAWYEPLTNDKRFIKHTQAEIWRVIDRISRRMSEIDLVRFLSQDVLDCLHQHFKDIRLAKK